MMLKGNKGKGEIRNDIVTFDEAENYIPRNAAISRSETSGISVESRVNFAARDVLIQKESIGRYGRRVNPRGKSKTDDCPCIIDTGFNGWGESFVVLIGSISIWNIVKKFAQRRNARKPEPSTRN